MISTYTPNITQLKFLKQRRRIGNRKLSGEKRTYISKRPLSDQRFSCYYGLRAARSVRVSSKIIETFVQIIKKHLKRSGWLRLCYFPHISATSKPIQVRMGKGKGSIDYWYTVVPTGGILFELADFDLDFLQVKKLANMLSLRVSVPFKAIIIK
jgi:ribosomal protein L16